MFGKINSRRKTREAQYVLMWHRAGTYMARTGGDCYLSSSKSMDALKCSARSSSIDAGRCRILLTTQETTRSTVETYSWISPIKTLTRLQDYFSIIALK